MIFLTVHADNLLSEQLNIAIRVPILNEAINMHSYISNINDALILVFVTSSCK